MDPLTIFGLSVLGGFVAWGLVLARFAWPPLRGRSRPDALRPLLLLHIFRFAGLAFLVPGVVSPDLPAAFARPAAYGDFLSALLALAAFLALGTPAGIGLVWVFNLVGSVDLLYAFYQGVIGAQVAPGLLGAAYFIPTVFVPLLLITHGMMFRLLLEAPGPPRP